MITNIFESRKSVVGIVAVVVIPLVISIVVVILRSRFKLCSDKRKLGSEEGRPYSNGKFSQKENDDEYQLSSVAAVATEVREQHYTSYYHH